MLISKYSGKTVKSFPGAVSLAEGPTFAMVEVISEDKREYELYFKETYGLCIEDDISTYVGDYLVKPEFDRYQNMYYALQKLIQMIEESKKFSKKSLESLKDWYNNYYKNETFYEKIN